MKRNSEHIDQLFKSKLEGYVSTPPPYVLNRITEGIEKQKKARRIVLYRILSTAALVVLAFGLGFIINLKPVDDLQISGLEQEHIKPLADENLPEDHEFIQKYQNIKNKYKVVNASESTKAVVMPTIKKEAKSDEDILDRSDMEYLSSRSPEYSTSDSPTPSYLILGDDFKIIPPEMISGFEEKETDNNYHLAGFYSPDYSYRRSIPDDNFFITPGNIELNEIRNKEKAIAAFSTGVSLAFNYSDRVEIESGFHYSRIGQNSEGSYAPPQNYDPKQGTIFQNSAGPVKLNSNFSFDELMSIQRDHADVIEGFGADILQQFDYIEIPLIVKYEIIDHFIKVKILGGVSTGVLVNNRSFLQFEDYSEEIGLTNHINSFNYNSLIGFGIELPISSNLHFKVEPRFKYALRPINRYSDLKYLPYSFGLATGVSFNF